MARESVGLREQGKNFNPGFQKFWDATGYKEGMDNREPYCSAFASYCVQEADRREAKLFFPVPPTFAACRQWKIWAQRYALIRMRDPFPGDVVCFLDYKTNSAVNGHFSHVGIVDFFDEQREVVHTIEANTNAAGSREGDGVYEKQRPLGVCGFFITLPAHALPA